MTLPASGPLSISQINTELGSAATAALSFGSTAVRTLAGVPSGPISIGNFYGKSNTQPLTPTGFNTLTGTSPVNNYFRRYIMHWVYTGAEINVTYSRSSGTVNSITINVNSVPTYQPYPDYAVGMKQGTYGSSNPGNTGYTIVRTATSQSFVSGNNNIALTSPFAWAGQDLAIAVAWGQCPTDFSQTGTSQIINTGTMWFSRTDGGGTYVINTDNPGEVASYRPIVTLNWA